MVGNERIEARTGGEEFFNYYPYRGLFERTNVVFYDGSFVSTPASGRISGRPVYSLESTRTVDAGSDIWPVRNKFSFSADLRRKTTNDIVLTLDIPNYLGYEDDTKTGVGSA